MDFLVQPPKKRNIPLYLRCMNCKQKITKGFSVGADVFCSRKCLWEMIKIEIYHNTQKFTSVAEAIEDEVILDCQEAIFDDIAEAQTQAK